MVKTECSRQDCYFRVGEMCCNLCAKGENPCDLYWPAMTDAETDAGANANRKDGALKKAG